MPDLLFLAHRLPYPPDKGDKIRAWHFLCHLARTHRIHLGCFIDDPEDWAQLPAVRRVCADVACFPLNRRLGRVKALARVRPGVPLSLGYFHSPRLARWVNARLADPAVDRLFVFSSAMAPYVMHATAAIRVLDMVDVDSTKWRSYAATARPPMRAVWSREARTLLAFERQAAAHFDQSLFVSEQEWQHFVSLAPEAAGRTGWIENGVDLRHFAPCADYQPPFAPTGADLVFTGRMDYRPNIEAVQWFAHSVMPPLRRQCPAARFWIVGAAPTRDVTALAAVSGVRVTGRVPDTRPYLAHAAAVVAPLRIARGIQNKVLEAMAMARPVIASQEAFEGIRARPGQDILLAGGVEETVRSILQVLEGQHPTLGPCARRAIEQAHQWSATLRPLDRLFPPAGHILRAPCTTRSGLPA